MREHDVIAVGMLVELKSTFTIHFDKNPPAKIFYNPMVHGSKNVPFLLKNVPFLFKMCPFFIRNAP